MLRRGSCGVRLRAVRVMGAACLYPALLTAGLRLAEAERGYAPPDGASGQTQAGTRSGSGAGDPAQAHVPAEKVTPTWQVFANLVQVPVLVLSPAQGHAAPLSEDRFRVSVDGGPLFRATHVRVEGEDPISLSILIHVSGPDQRLLLPKMSDAVAELVPRLRTRDRVSVYALDCALTRSAEEMAPNRLRLKNAVDAALTSWRERPKETHRTDCKNRLQLRDAIAFLASSMQGQPGWHVLLAITDGEDGGSKNSWNGIRTYAQAESVAIFGIMHRPDSWRLNRANEDLFNAVCQLTGGLMLFSDANDLARTMGTIMAMVRERYVVEFPRPVSVSSGRHRLVVSIDGSKDFIRSAGISVPLPDPVLLADPRTIPEDPSKAPVPGSQRILNPPR